MVVKKQKLLQAMDHIRERYGNGVLHYGRTEVRRQRSEVRGQNSRGDRKCALILQKN